MFRHITRHRRNLGAATALAVTLALVQPAAASAQTAPDPPAPTASAAYSGPVSSANARFVVDRYQTVLGRAPETNGLDFHLARLASGGAETRQNFVWAMLFSVEGSRQEVDRAYGDLLHRSADPAGRSYWTQHLQGHDVLDLRVLLLSSPEYRNRAGGTDQAWVVALYDDILGRAPEPAGLAYWTGQAGSGVPRPLIAAAVYAGDEALARRTIDYYQEILHRNPTAAERVAGRATIRRSGERGLRAELLASDEAFEPFLQAALS